MKTLELKLTRIGNSKGIRLPVELIQRYGFDESLAAEIREEGILLKPRKQTKLSWADTASAMAASNEDWTEWDATLADGLESCPWDEISHTDAQRKAPPQAGPQRRSRKEASRRAKV